ncbi:MAG: cytochrome c1 [Pseudomonadota bacterium]
MKLFALLTLLLSSVAHGAGGGAETQKVNNDLSNVNSLQRGAKYFVNYCLGCHSAKYVRYNRLAEDLNLSEDQLIGNLMFTADKPHEPIDIAMSSTDAERWFGIAPPDLSLIARSRNPDWLYTYLRSFYVDESSSFSTNNLLLPGSSMPNPLWELQGLQRAVFHEATDDAGNMHMEFQEFVPLTEGTMSSAEFDDAIRDIVNFLEYIGEPVKLQRQKIGIYVIAFLLLFFLFAYLLKKEIWSSVH